MTTQTMMARRTDRVPDQRADFVIGVASASVVGISCWALLFSLF